MSYLMMTMSQYNENYLFFCDPIKNNIMLNGHFIRLIYSTKHVTMNSIYLILPFKILGMSKYYNKCKYDIELTNEIEKIKNMEMSILRKLNTHGKTPQYNIYEHMQKGCIKNVCDYKEESNTLVLKISGIWETDEQYGITYKFIAI